MRSAPLLALLALLPPALPAAARQAPVRVEGRVVDARDGGAISDATVQLGTLPAATTDPAGIFRFDDVASGSYTLRVTALGYASRELPLVISGDTTLTVALEVAPLALDTLAVEGRTISVKGEVRERVSGRRLMDVQVLAGGGLQTRSNTAGRFTLKRVPAAVPVRMVLRGLGYLPADTIVTASRDTTLRFMLERDSLAQLMIAAQVDRLEKRSHPFRTAIMPAIGREELVTRYANYTLLDVMRTRYSMFIGRVRCTLIDDRQTYNGLEEFAMILPQEVQRIEFLYGGAMLRVYTRNYITKMMAGGVELVRPVYFNYGRVPLCR